MAVKPDDKGAARLARPGAAFKQYWVLFIGKITAAQPFEYSLAEHRREVRRAGGLLAETHGALTAVDR